MSLLFAALLTGALSGGVDLKELSIEDRHEVEVETWRQQRIERLKAPGGWLSLVGLHWLKDGANSVGGGKGNDVVIAGAPEKLGVVTVAGKEVSIVLEPRAATINGSDKASRANLRDDSTERPTTVAFGTTSFYLIDRGGKKALRVKDSEAATRKNFVGIENFPVSAQWRIEAKWEAFDPPREMEVPNITGAVEKYKVPGKAVFKIDGKEYSVQPVLETADAKELFLIFADKTSGKETYGAARFLYAALPADGKIVLDFNKAYNPPCAFTPYATCPLAPPENKLAVRVTAGEKKYKGPGAH
jgi:uncharacterized protein